MILIWFYNEDIISYDFLWSPGYRSGSVPPINLINRLPIVAFNIWRQAWWWLPSAKACALSRPRCRTRMNQTCRILRARKSPFMHLYLGVAMFDYWFDWILDTFRRCTDTVSDSWDWSLEFNKFLNNSQFYMLFDRILIRFYYDVNLVVLRK